MSRLRRSTLSRTAPRLAPILALLLVAGCQQKMAAQPSYKPLEPSTFFPDGQSARPPVAGTVARGHLRTDLALFTGKTTAENRDWTDPAAPTVWLALFYG